MRMELLITFAALWGVTLGGGALAGDASTVEKQKDWEKIIVPADAIMVKSVPNPAQLRYQTDQYGAFLHYGPAVFLDGDWAATPDPKVFNPTQLDAEQWVLVAKSFGAKHLIFSAKHHNGFCLWPTKTTDYSVHGSPWKNGQGDVVRELADACKKHGIALGLYYSGQDRHFPCHSLDPAAMANREAYWPVYKQQIEELMTNYDDIVCLWLDGYGDPFLADYQAINPKTGKPYGDEAVAMVKAKQPNIVIFQGARPEVRYCCATTTEDGTSLYPLWNALRKGEPTPLKMSPWTEGWVIPETYNCHGTFAWVPATPEKLMEEYYVSVGRGANFLQALVPDKRGLIDEAQAKSMAEFGAELVRRFGHPIACTDSDQGWTEPGILELNLGGGEKKIAHVILEEEIAKGQHVVKYVLDAAVGGTWKPIAEGQSIGRKRIERFQPPITAEKIRLRIVQANAIPSISSMQAHGE